MKQGNGAGRKVSGGKGKIKRGNGMAGKLILAVVTLCNLILSLILTLENRREVLHAVQEDEGVKLLLTEEKRTKN